MRILHVLPTLNIGGAETLVVELLINLKKSGYDVFVFLNINTKDTQLYQKLKEYQIPIFTIIEYTTGFNILDSALRRLLKRSMYWRAINKIQPDIIHFHLDILPDIEDIKKYGKIKLYYTCHGDIERYIKMFGETWRKNIKYFLENNLMKCFVINKDMLRNAIKLITNKNIYYIPNGIDMENKKSYERKNFLRENGIKTDSFIIGHVGRLIEVKNQKKSIKILKEVLKIRKNTVLLFIGDGDREYREELKDYIKKYKLSSNIIFLGYRSDVREIISILDIALLPSLSEGFPLTILEYQLYNIRTLVSEAIPEETICNANCFRISLKQKDKEWANYIFGNQMRKVTKELNKFDLKEITKKYISYYLEK